MILAFALQKRVIGDTPKQEANEQIEDTVILQPRLLYGLAVDSFRIEQKKIRRNQFMANIMQDLSLPDSTIYTAVQKSQGIFDLRSIKSGDSYTLFYNRDSASLPSYLVYEPNDLDYIVFNFKNSIDVSKGHRRTDTVELYASGIINNSLWETLQNNNDNPELTFMLSEVFAWQIDFYRLQKGDKFKVIYEQVNIDNEPYGINRIDAAWFEHGDEKYYGFRYTKDTLSGFFDEEGNSLRKELLKTPLKFYRISSRYSHRRFHPVNHRYEPHLGTDYAAPTGTPIRTTGDGDVVEARYSRFNGNYVKIRHNSVYTTQYLHMSRFAAGIKPGVHVNQGQTIGYVGSTGLATGPHVCYRFWLNGRQVDAQKVKLPPSNPIPAGISDDYRVFCDSVRSRIDSIKIFEPELVTRAANP
jgi:murein DD-endopeptidase MepM/ murein hydrolase activator NlpD